MCFTIVATSGPAAAAEVTTRKMIAKGRNTRFMPAVLRSI
jgi:hypothetical protein